MLQQPPGMAAIFTTIVALLKSGDHIVASHNMFGSTVVLLDSVVAKFGIKTTFVDLTDIQAWQDSVQTNTKMFLLETPSNPLNEAVDLEQLAAIAKKNNILLAVDNCLLTPILQQPLALGADIVIHSATKYIDGQGRCLGGAVLGSSALMAAVDNVLRTTGPSLSPFNAWLLLKGLETLSLRIKAHCDNALALARWLTQQQQVEKVYYLALSDHPQHRLAKRQQSGFGGIVSFVVKGGKEVAWRVIDQAKFLSITANLGDAKTTITHPATTTHARLSDKQKKTSGYSGRFIENFSRS